jgi:hypothetical protein
MTLNHQDIVCYIVKIIATVINWILLLIFILFMGVIIYGFYIFICKPYKPGEEPHSVIFKRLQTKPPASTYVMPDNHVIV